MTKNKRSKNARSGRLVFLALALLMLFLMLPITWYFFLPSNAEILIPVNLESNNPGFTILDETAKVLHLSAKGSRLALFRLKKKLPVYEPNLDIRGNGHICVDIGPEDFSLPKGVKFISVTPERFCFNTKKQIKKEVFVIVITAGEPVSGYTVAQIWTTPMRVILKGPEDVLAPIAAIHTKAVDISQARGLMKTDIPLKLPESVMMVRSCKTVKVFVEITKEKKMRNFRKIPVQGRGGKNFSINPAMIDLLLQGPITTLDALEKNSGMEVFVDLKGLTPGVYVRRARIRLPLDVLLLDAAPEVFTINITGP